jgi:hypothetical protein
MLMVGYEFLQSEPRTERLRKGRVSISTNTA